MCSYYPVKVRGWFRVKMLAAHKRVVILPPIFPIFVCKQFKMFENLEKLGQNLAREKEKF